MVDKIAEGKKKQRMYIYCFELQLSNILIEIR